MLRETAKTSGASRPSLLIELRLTDKLGLPLDPSIAWQALLIAFKDHAHFQVESALMKPDKKGALCEEAS